MSLAATNRESSRAGAFGTRAIAILFSRWTALALVAFAVAQQSVGHHNADNAWLFTVVEKILAGERPYIDVLETNPPASFLIYMPAAMLAHMLHLSVEFVVSALIFAGAAGVVWFTATILREAGLLPRDEEGFLLVAAVFTLLAIPSFTFAEREHIAVIGVLPLLAIHAARLSGVAPALRSAVVAGLMAGLIVSIKPHFALAVGLSFLAVLRERPSPATIFRVENICAVAVALFYLAVVVAFFPAFFNVLPAIVDAYVAVRQHWSIMLGAPWFVLNMVLLVVAAMIGGRACLAPRALPPLLASIGFTLTYFWQGKGWMNHELPAIALLCLALASIVAPMLAELRKDGHSLAWSRARAATVFAAFPAALCAPLLFGATIQWSMAEEHEGLTAAVRRLAPVHPRIIALSPQLTAGFPLVRRLDGVWVGRAQRLWLTVSARMLLAANRGDDAYRARLTAYVADDAAMFLADVRAGKPDVILVDQDPRVADAMASIPDLAAALENYSPGETAEDFVVWTRRLGV